jgi:hypothetical protein
MHMYFSTVFALFLNTRRRSCRIIGKKMSLHFISVLFKTLFPYNWRIIRWLKGFNDLLNDFVVN